MNPVFNSANWHSCENHDANLCSDGSNCYAYVLNRPDYHWAVPGFGFAKMPAKEFFTLFYDVFKKYTSAEFRHIIRVGAKHDGLLRIDKPLNKDGYYLVMLAFPKDNADHDFHWYRKDADGTWSHKNGWHRVSNTDETGRIITDPYTAIRNEYPVFGGFYLVPKSGVTLSKNSLLNDK